jgi:hypothetical protein
MAVTYNRYKLVAVSLPKRFRNGRLTSKRRAAVSEVKRETATWIQKWF